MQKITTDYGLIYNTDGTLCTTYRDDDVPFAGVRSFAVETATTNYWNNDITDYAYNIKSGSVTFENTVYNGRPALKCIVTGTDPYIQMAFKHSAGNINPNDTYTASIGVAALSSEITGLVDSAAYLYFTTLTFGGFGSVDHNWGKAGNRIYATYTRPTDDTTTSFYASVYFKEAGTFYLYDYQLEKKPFASSFVDGSRPTGIIAVPFHFDLNTEDWVVSFWHKMTNTYSFANKIIFSIDGVFHLNTYYPSEGKYNWVCRNTDNVIFRASSTTTVDTNWNFIVLVKNGLNFKVYINGILEITLNYIGTLNYNVNNFKFGNFKIGELGYVSNSLFSNIYIGKYRRPDGTVIWTDDYICEVYEAKIPYVAKSKPLVI